VIAATHSTGQGGGACWDRALIELRREPWQGVIFAIVAISAMAKGGRVTLNIAVSEPHKASLAPSFNKELCPLCYENLMAAIAEALSKPNQVPAARLVQTYAGAFIGGPGPRRS
jgi:hypothetical protein